MLEEQNNSTQQESSTPPPKEKKWRKGSKVYEEQKKLQDASLLLTKIVSTDDDNKSLPSSSSTKVDKLISNLAETKRAKAKEFLIPPIKSSSSLDETFKNYISDIHECFLYLERYSSDFPEISKLVSTYHQMKDKEKFSSSFSLDRLSELSQVSRGDIRRLLISTIDYLSTDEASLAISLSRPHLVKKSISIAMDEEHPDSQAERKGWLQHLGFLPSTKGQQVQVNVNSGNIQDNRTAIVNGLPSFSAIASQGEVVVHKSLKESFDEEVKGYKELEGMKEEQVIDIQPEKIGKPFSIVKPKEKED